VLVARFKNMGHETAVISFNLLYDVMNKGGIDTSGKGLLYHLSLLNCIGSIITCG
jgi:hypothetical protein